MQLRLGRGARLATNGVRPLIDTADVIDNMPASGAVDVTLRGMTAGMIAALSAALSAGAPRNAPGRPVSTAAYFDYDALVDAVCNGLNAAGLPA